MTSNIFYSHDLVRLQRLVSVPQIRLYARPDAIASGAGDYALHITKRLLGFYQDYFKVQYSLPKLGRLTLISGGGGCTLSGGYLCSGS